MSEPIEVHVLGARKGESIIIRLPGHLWGVVDNYTPNLKQPDTNPTLRLLNRLGVTRLAFLCLTHPHEDHYRGMSYLLERFSPDRVWIFGSMTHRYLYQKIAEIFKAGAVSKNVAEEDHENADELVKIFDLIQSQYEDRRRHPQIDIRRLQLGQSLLELPSSPSVRVVAIGASGGRAIQYESTLTACFDARTGFLASRLPTINHNIISGGLLIEYGQARIVLGGDIDGASWAETITQLNPSRLSSNLVKVSHHGSTTGYCDGLWQVLSPKGGATAAITPYSSQGLPSPEGLAHISQQAKLTLTASRGGAALANDWHDKANDTIFQGLSGEALLMLRSLFPKATTPSSRMEGICSFRIFEDGSIQNSFEGEGGYLQNM